MPAIPAAADLFSLLTEYVAAAETTPPRPRRRTPQPASPQPAPPVDAGEYERRVAALTQPGTGRGLGTAAAAAVAEGVGVYVTGMLPTGVQASLTGYVLAAFEAGKNFEGWTTEDCVVVVVAEHPEHLDGVPVQVPVDGQLVVVDADEALAAGSVNTWVRPTLKQALRHAGLELGPADGPGVVSNKLAWNMRNLDENLSKRMFSERGGVPAGAWRSVLRQGLVDKARADGVWPGPAEAGPVPLRLVRQGAHGMLAGTVDGQLVEVTGEFVYCWSRSSGADRRTTANVQMRVPVAGEHGWRAVTVEVPATGVVFHLQTAADAAARPAGAAGTRRADRGPSAGGPAR